MADVTVTCGCGRKMTQRGTDPAGTYRCGCGARVRIHLAGRASCTGRTDDGTSCRTAASRESAALGLTLCAGHLATLAALFEEAHAEDMRRIEDEMLEREARLERGWDEFRAVQATWDDSPGVRRWGARELRRMRDEDGSWVVYYIRIGDVIKIGTTGDFKRRMGCLMPDEILAAEPGGFKLERERHRQFIHLRIRGERFRAGSDLLAHIDGVRQQHGEGREGLRPEQTRLGARPEAVILGPDPRLR